MGTKKIDAVFTLKDAFSDKMKIAIGNMKKGGTEAKSLSREIKKAGKKMEEAGTLLTKGFTVPILAVGTASIAAWQQVDAGSDAIVRATGASGTSLKDFNEIMKDVAKKVPSEFENIGKALGEINTRFGFTGGVLSKSTTDFMKFAEITGLDATTGVQLVSRAMGDAGIPASKYKEVLDSVAKAAQISGIGQDVLLESITKFGAPMRALGFDMNESMALFSGWEKAGVTTSIAFSGLKKSISTWAKEGKDPREEFKKTMQVIKDAPDLAKATGTAIEMFGVKAGPDLADAIREGRFNYEDYLTSIKKSKGTVNKTFKSMQDPIDKLKTTMNGLKGAGSELGGTLIEILIPHVEKLGKKIEAVGKWFSGLSKHQQELIVKLALTVAAIGPAVTIFGKLIGVMGGNITTIGKMLKFFRKGESAVSGLSKVVSATLKPFKSLGRAAPFVFKGIGKAATIMAKTFKFAFLTAVKALLGFGKFLLANPIVLAVTAIAVAAFFIIKHWKPIKKFFVKLWSGVTSTFKIAILWITKNFPLLGGIIRTQIQGIKDIFGGLKTTFGGIITFIQGVFTGNWKKAWEGVKNIFKGVFQSFGALVKTPMNIVIALINGAIKGINKISVKIPDAPGVPLRGKTIGFNISKIPMLYKGTDYWQGGTAMVHDRGAEIIDLPRGSRVYPHDKSMAMARGESSGNTTISLSIAKLAESIVVKSAEDIDKLTTILARKFAIELRKTAINTGGA